jgi:hypothetical protein
MDSRISRDRVSCALFTQNYRVSGMIAVSGAGLVGLVNDPTDSFIELEDASLVRLHRPQEIVAEFTIWSMVKARIIALLCERTSDLGRITVVRAGFTRQISYRIWASLLGFEMFGVLESPGKFDFSSQMFQGTRQFTPLFNATLIPVFFPQLVTRSPAILFNRQMIEGIGVISEVEEPAVEEHKTSGTGGLPRSSTGNLPQAGTSPSPRSGTGNLPQGGTEPTPRGGTGGLPRGGTGPVKRGGV